MTAKNNHLCLLAGDSRNSPKLRIGALSPQGARLDPSILTHRSAPTPAEVEVMPCSGDASQDNQAGAKQPLSSWEVPWGLRSTAEPFLGYYLTKKKTTPFLPAEPALVLGYGWEMQCLSPIQGSLRTFTLLKVKPPGLSGHRGHAGWYAAVTENQHLGQPKQMSLKTSAWEGKQYGKNFQKKTKKKKSPFSSKRRLEIFALQEIPPAGRFGFKLT